MNEKNSESFKAQKLKTFGTFAPPPQSIPANVSIINFPIRRRFNLHQHSRMTWYCRGENHKIQENAHCYALSSERVPDKTWKTSPGISLYTCVFYNISSSIFLFFTFYKIKEMPTIKIQVTLRSRTLPWLLYPPILFYIISSVKASLEASIGIKITLKRNFDSMKTFCLHFWIKLIRLKAEFKWLWIKEKIIKYLNL